MIDDLGQTNDFSKLSVQSGNSSVSYVSNIFNYNNNIYVSKVATEVAGGGVIAGSKVGGLVRLC